MKKFLFQIGSIKSAGDAVAAGDFARFLFQIGSIKSQRYFITSNQAKEFLFQIGSIKSYRQDVILSFKFSFYSKLVRLKVFSTARVSP